MCAFSTLHCGFDNSIKALVVNWLHPLMLLVAKSKDNDANNQHWNQVMNGPYSGKYLKTACTKVKNLEKM